MKFRKWLVFATTALLVSAVGFAADSKISDLTAVTTPTAASEFAVNEGGTSKKMTLTQVYEVPASTQILIDSGTDALPGIGFNGDSDTGIYQTSAGVVNITNDGTVRVIFSGTRIASVSGPALMHEAPSATNPSVIATTADLDTGIGRAAVDALSAISGSVEAQRWTEASSAVLTAYQANVGLTADVGSAQGDGIITSSYNVYSVVGTAGDAATLPATFIVGTPVYVKNDDSTDSMDVFPASGDDAGSGTDTAVALAAGNGAFFMGTVADATWTKMLDL